MKEETFGFDAQLVLLENCCAAHRKRLGEGCAPLSGSLQASREEIIHLSLELLNGYTSETDPLVRTRALLSLLDAYEISREESLLSQVLAWAEELMGQLPSSPLKCKLLSYCYYYTEDESCACEAKRIIAGWQVSALNGEMKEALACYETLV